MKVKIDIQQKTCLADTSKPLDISIPVTFETEQLSAFGGPAATSETYAVEGFTGNVADGGSCNCNIYHFSPHLNGTHTECVGHISKAPISVNAIIQKTILPSTLITVEPEKADSTTETYDPALQNDDFIITKSHLENALRNTEPDFLRAVIIRTMPNAHDKKTRDYGIHKPPFFTNDAMKFLAEQNVQHLLVDMPSVDRLNDDGKLSNHRIFWEIEPGCSDIDPATSSQKTITELIYVPDEIKDGHYLLNLQVAAIESDAAPSRPVLYEMKDIN